MEVVIEQKDASLVEADKRIEIFRVMINDLSRQNAVLREENARLNELLKDSRD
jgi:uncharacterized protein YqiB (DUF1249 family)